MFRAFEFVILTLFRVQDFEINEYCITITGYEYE